MSTYLSTIDLFLIGVFVVYLLWHGYANAMKKHSQEDYFLAGRSLTWPFIGISLFASNMSSSTLIGLSSSGYETGISVFNYEWVGTIILIIFAIYFIPVYLNSKLYTMPELLEKRFDKRSRYYFSTLTIIANIGIDTAGTLYAGGLIIQILFPEINISTSIIVLAVIAGLYTITGGLKAVVFTDAIQGILLTIGSIAITILVFQHIGSWEAVKEAAKPDSLSLIPSIDDPFLPWPTIFISLPLLGFYFWCSNQFVVQRVLGAKSIDHGRKGALFAGFLKLFVLFIMVMPGVMALGIYPDLENPNTVYPRLMIDFLPVGLLGLVLVGFLAALLSSVDSALHSASTLVTMDFYKKYRPNAGQIELVRMGKVFTLLFVIVASVWAPYIDSFPTLWDYLQAALSYLTPPVVVCFIFGMFWKKATPLASISSLIVGGISAVLVFVFKYLGVIPEIHYLYVAVILFVISMIVMIMVSYLEASEPKTDDLYTLYGNLEEDDYNKSQRFYSNFKFQAITLVVITIIVVLAFL